MLLKWAAGILSSWLVYPLKSSWGSYAKCKIGRSNGMGSVMGSKGAEATGLPPGLKARDLQGALALQPTCSGRRELASLGTMPSIWLRGALFDTKSGALDFMPGWPRRSTSPLTPLHTPKASSFHSQTEISLQTSPLYFFLGCPSRHMEFTGRGSDLSHS